MSSDTIPATSDWGFNITLKVFDPRQLHAAARQRMYVESDPLDANLDTFAAEVDGLLGTADDPDIAACLVMLLDPGSLPGCSVYGTAIGDGWDPS